VQTIHDVIPLTYDHPVYRRGRTAWRWWSTRVVRATALVAVSEFSAREAERVLGLPPASITVAYEGVSPVPVAKLQRQPENPYVLFVGEFDPRKGHAEAFDVISRLGRRGYPHTLKVVGRIAPWIETELRGLVARSGEPNRIELAGFISEEDMAAAYQGATALLVTSRAEGFGLPAVEAMAGGTPVVAFANSATAEVVDGGGVLVADGDVAAITEAVAALIDDAELRKRLSEKGRNRAADFDWGRCAAIYASVFEKVALR